MGAGTSTSRTSVDNLTKSSISSAMSANINASASTNCANAQTVIGARGCDITFGPQACKASVISDFVGSQNMSASFQQDVMNDLTAKSQAAMEGLVIGFASSDSSTIMKNQVDVSQNISQSFMTDCTRDLKAMNMQSIVDCENSTINLNTQSMEASVIGACVADQIGDTESAQSLTNVIDAASSAKTSGLDVIGLIVAAMLPFLMMMGVPLLGMLGFGIVASMFALVALFIALVVFVWPGTTWCLDLLVFDACLPSVARAFNLAPFFPEVPLSDKFCSANSDGTGTGHIRNDTVVNRFMWIDNQCLSQKDKASCTEAEKIKSFKSCGAFQKNNMCQDKRFLEGRSKYIAVDKICNEIAMPEGGLKYCNAEHLTNKFFAPSGAKGYDGCMRCTGPTSKTWGMWVKKPESGDPSVANMCSALDHVKHYVGASKCSDSGEAQYCHSNDELRQMSPYECLNPAYQQAKEKFSKTLRKCEELEKNLPPQLTAAQNNGVPIEFSRQCPPNLFDYVTECDKETGKCNYEAVRQTGESDASFAAQQLACKNSFTGCTDEDYVSQTKMHEALEKECIATSASRSPTVLEYGVYAVVALIYAAYFWYVYRTVKKSTTTAAAVPEEE